MAYAAVGFDLLTALLDTWTLWADVAGDRALGMRWHAASQERLRGKRYRPFEEIVGASAAQVVIDPHHSSALLPPRGPLAPGPDLPPPRPRLQPLPPALPP